MNKYTDYFYETMLLKGLTEEEKKKILFFLYIDINKLLLALQRRNFYK